MDIDIQSESISNSSTASIISIVADKSPPRRIEDDYSPITRNNFNHESVFTLFRISLQKTKDFHDENIEKKEAITRRKCECNAF